jgi:hypothetical protein
MFKNKKCIHKIYKNNESSKKTVVLKEAMILPGYIRNLSHGGVVEDAPFLLGVSQTITYDYVTN